MAAVNENGAAALPWWTNNRLATSNPQGHPPEHVDIVGMVLYCHVLLCCVVPSSDHSVDPRIYSPNGRGTDRRFGAWNSSRR